MDAIMEDFGAGWIMTVYSSYFYFFSETASQVQYGALGPDDTVALLEMQFMKHVRIKLCSCVFH